METPQQHSEMQTQTGRSRLSELCIWLCGMLYALVVVPPWIPTFLTSGEYRDPSWRYMLHEAFIKRMEFGREIIFTYGPYGFLTTRMYHPQTYTLMLWVWIALTFLFFAAVWRMVRPRCHSSWTALMLCMVVTRVVFVDAMIFFFALLVLLIARRHRQDCYLRSDINSGSRQRELLPASAGAVDDQWAAIRAYGQVMTDWRIVDAVIHGLLILAVGLLPLTKYSFVPAVFFVAVVLGAIDLWKRRWPIDSAGIVAGMLIAWVVSGQSADIFLSWLAAGFEVASRYTDAMTNWEQSAFDTGLVITAALCIVAVPVLCRVPGLRTDGGIHTVYAAMWATLLFLVFKFTCVGFHAHKMPIYFGSALLVAFANVAVQNSAAAGVKHTVRKRSVAASMMTGGLFVLSLVTSYARFVTTDQSIPVLVAVGNGQNLSAMLRWLHSGETWMRQHNAENLNDIRRMHPLPAIEGTIDVVPDKLAMGIACPTAQFVPRPLLHTYATHSEWLAEQNAQHYRSGRAPDFVLFRVNPIVGRYPTLNDGRLWLELLRRYDLRDSLKTDLLLERRSIDRELRLETFPEQAITWKKWVPVAADQRHPLWVSLQIEKSAAGRLTEFAYKLPEVWMDVRTRDGCERTYRITTASASSGFILSPLLRSRQAFARLIGCDFDQPLPMALSGEAVTQIRLHTSAAAEYCYKKRLTMQLSRILLRETDLSLTSLDSLSESIEIR